MSAKTNTTAMSVLGAFTEGEAQVALFDTPGVVASSYLHGDKHASRVRSAWATAEKCRALLIIIDAHRQVCPPGRAAAAGSSRRVCRMLTRGGRGLLACAHGRASSAVVVVLVVRVPPRTSALRLSRMARHVSRELLGSQPLHDTGSRLSLVQLKLFLQHPGHAEVLGARHCLGRSRPGVTAHACADICARQARAAPGRGDRPGPLAWVAAGALPAGPQQGAHMPASVDTDRQQACRGRCCRGAALLHEAYASKSQQCPDQPMLLLDRH